ncbi:MAG: UDP-2,3-diacylglucosamine diphosphatase [Bacteroidales bacterium]|nr:UDP-2,3-diacylglucosamine diphosphatase [Bacteroidales bacterium]
MTARRYSYFVADAHLGLDVKDMKGREERFVSFLRSIPAEETEALYLMGDIWDFWYEYRDLVPKGYVRVFAALVSLMDSGVKVYFFQGNHDIWSYNYFESLGMERLIQPHVCKIGDKLFCLGHGDGLGPGMHGYKIMRWCFHNRFLQKCFSGLHPWFAFRLGQGWSKSSRLAKNVEYVFKGTDEPLYKWADAFQNGRGEAERVDYFIFGHFHTSVDMELESGGRLLVLKDWMDSSPYMVFDSVSGEILVVK